MSEENKEHNPEAEKENQTKDIVSQAKELGKKLRNSSPEERWKIMEEFRIKGFDR